MKREMDPAHAVTRNDFGGLVPSIAIGGVRDLSVGDAEMRLVVDATLNAAAIARRAFATWPSAMDLDAQLQEDTLVVVSELVTNAVRHAKSPSEIIATVTEEALRLEVHDLVADPPVRRDAAGGIGGYGLRIVAKLTDRWGWRPTATGKYVWTETDRGLSASRIFSASL